MSELLFLHYIHMVISFRFSPLVSKLGDVQCASDVQSEFASVLNRSTVFVSPLVRYVLQKLVDEVAICSV